MDTTISAVVAPLVERKIFDTEEEAVRSLLREYILGQIERLRQDIALLEQKYGMRFEQFAAYVHERSVLLEQGDLSPERRRVLGQVIM